MPSANVFGLALSFDGSRLAAGLSDGIVTLWDSRGIGGSMASLDGYARKGGQLEFSPGGYHLAFSSEDGSIGCGTDSMVNPSLI
jgi:WD40 repeat protein